MVKSQKPSYLLSLGSPPFSKEMAIIWEMMDLLDVRGIYCNCGMIFVWTDVVNSAFYKNVEIERRCPHCGRNLMDM